MASSAKDIPLRELKDTIPQLKTMVSEQTGLIKSLRLMIDQKSSHEKALQEQVDYLTKKLFGTSSERRADDIRGSRISSMKRKWDRIRLCFKKRLCSGNMPVKRRQPMRNSSKV